MNPPPIDYSNYPKVVVVQASSACHEEENFANITINGVSVQIEKHDTGFCGLHVVIINSNTGQVESAKAYESFKNFYKFEEFVDKITKKMPKGHIAVAAIKNDIHKKLYAIGRNFFQTLGSDEIWDMGYREAFCFIG